VRAAMAPSTLHGSENPNMIESLTNTPSQPASSAATASPTASSISRGVLVPSRTPYFIMVPSPGPEARAEYRQVRGSMFWFMRKRLSGSHACLSFANRVWFGP
jgi:hypothetical protein